MTGVHPVTVVHLVYLFAETAELNSKKLDRKQDLNLFYEVCIFRADPKIKIAYFFGFSETAEQKMAHCTEVHNLWPFWPLLPNYVQNLHVNIDQERNPIDFESGSKVMVNFGTLCIKPCGHDADCSFNPITLKFHMLFFDV